MEFEGTNRQDVTMSHLSCTGPLNLHRNSKKADTVFQTVLYIDEKEFDALVILAEREGDTVTFEHLYRSVWDEWDGMDQRAAAEMGLGKLINEVRKAGEGFMWIEHSPDKGYSFRTRWGHNWKTCTA